MDSDRRCFAVIFLVLGSILLKSLSLTASEHPPRPVPGPDLVELGRATYVSKCVACHGDQGRGDGIAAYLLYPKPRDFVVARYRLISTWERVPTDQDLFDTLTRGMPGSAMPSWGHLPERTRWGLVDYVKSLAAEPWDIAPSSDPPGEGASGTGVIRVPPEPPHQDGDEELAASFFKDACAGCHGFDGRGDGQQKQVDNEGFPTRPRDLTRGIYKGRPDPESVYRHIVAGLPGTPMPMSDWSYGDNAWHLVRFVLELSTAEQRNAALMTTGTIRALRVKRLPEADEAWKDIPATRVTLMPLWWRNERVDEAEARAVHDGKRLAVRLRWRDAGADDAVLGQTAFTDGVALQFSEETDPPLFAMGTPDSHVSIWYWRAAWERDQADGPPQLTASHPAMPKHAYPGHPDLPGYATGIVAGNPVSGTNHVSSVEDLRAKGFGTLTSQQPGRRSVRGKGVWDNGWWTVTFVREMKARDEGDVRLDRGVRMSAAIWDGAAGDRNGQKSVSIWHDLVIER